MPPLGHARHLLFFGEKSIFFKHSKPKVRFVAFIGPLPSLLFTGRGRALLSEGPQCKAAMRSRCAIAIRGLLLLAVFGR